MRLRIPTSLPVLLSLFPPACFCAYNLTALAVHMRIGRPSSTDGVVYVVIAIIGYVIGAVSTVVGIALMYFLLNKRVNILLSRTGSWIVLGASAAAVVALALAGRASAITYELAQPRPGVVKASVNIRRLETPPPVSGEPARAPLSFAVYPERKVDGRIEWNGAAVDISPRGGSLTIKESGGRLIAATDLMAYEYMNVVHATPFCGAAQDDKWLAVLVSLRATSRRSMLLVYSFSGGLVYQEYLDRGGYPDELRVATDLEGREVLMSTLR